MKAVVLLSGGVDSTVALALTMNAGMYVECLTVDYGQSHRREIESAAAICRFYGAAHHVVRLDRKLFGGSALTCGDADAIPSGHAESPDATYVPARNTVLLALGAARAESCGANCVVIGANADDEAGYPDCRREYLESFRDVLQRGTVNKVWLSAPVLGMRKREIVEVGERLSAPLDLTWSCYRGGEEPCGHCGACQTLKVATR